MPGSKAARDSGPSGVFLNLPFDRTAERLYLAYIAGVSAYGLVARSALEVPSGGRQYDRIARILNLIRECPYSVHDLSRVQLDQRAPRTPRFNMPFELGLAVAWAELARKTGSTQEHIWMVFEAEPNRLTKSLSDMRGVDEYVHEGTVEGVIHSLSNAFVRREHRPDVADILRIYRALRKDLGGIQKAARAKTPFEPRVFADLVVVARLNAARHIPQLPSARG